MALQLVCGSSLKSAKIASAYSRVLSACSLIPVALSLKTSVCLTVLVRCEALPALWQFKRSLKSAAFWPSSSGTVGKRIKNLSNRISAEFQEKRFFQTSPPPKTQNQARKTLILARKNSKLGTKSTKPMLNHSRRHKKIKKIFVDEHSNRYYYLPK